MSDIAWAWVIVAFFSLGMVLGIVQGKYYYIRRDAPDTVCYSIPLPIKPDEKGD